VPDNDKTQIEAESGCHNGAAPTGAPAVGPFTKAGYTNGDFHYVHGTPVMASMYGLDVLAPVRWGRAPALVLSGPNEGPARYRLLAPNAAALIDLWVFAD
jgi:broad specificity polyphosphatase/5'/3'-nucleotidase SurE